MVEAGCSETSNRKLGRDKMKRLAKWSGLLTIVVLCVSILNGVYLDIDRSELEAKYGSSSSKFMLMENGSRIHYRDEGHAEKTPLVLIHGFNGSLFNFSKLVPLIADDFRVISLDLPGFGLTGAVPTNDYSTENFIEVVQELSQELELGKFLIAGNSMGGGVSWALRSRLSRSVAWLDTSSLKRGKS